MPACAATLPDPQAEAQRQAYNAAFEELDLHWDWDCATFERLSAAGPARVRTWLEQEQPHLLRAYDADFLVAAVESTMQRCLRRAHRADPH